MNKISNINFMSPFSTFKIFPFFKIHKIKPVAADMVEIHTDSTCNGNWFGLCQGNIIYVLVPNGDSWRVKDIYAIEV